MTKAIDVKNINFSFGNNKVLDDLSFTVSEGKYVGVIGPNGGGKTTLLKLLTGLIRSESGQIKLFGKDIKIARQKGWIGYVPQRLAQESLNFPATVLEIIESGRVAQKGMGQNFNKNDRLAVDQAIEIAGIASLKNKLIDKISGGQRQRALVARALAGKPKILLLDEPFVGVDIASQQQFYKFLKKVNKDQGITILFVSHDIDVISSEVDEILCLNRRLVCAGDPHKVEDPDVIEELYGSKFKHIHH